MTGHTPARFAAMTVRPRSRGGLRGKGKRLAPAATQAFAEEEWEELRISGNTNADRPEAFGRGSKQTKQMEKDRCVSIHR